MNTNETQTVADTFNEQGYAYAGQLIDMETVETLRSELARVIDDRDRDDVPQPVSICNMSGNADATVWQVVDIWRASKAYEALLHTPAISALAAACIGAKELRLWHDQIQYKPAGTGGVNPWHQDAPYWGSITPKDEQITAWIALDDVDVDNGCMSMVPGSHKWGVAIDTIHAHNKPGMELPDTYEGHPVKQVTCPVPVGGVHFHHSLTWHGSHANTSGRPRRAIALHFMTDRTVRDANGSHLMDRFISAKPGEPMRDPEFPLLWSAA